jgi:hypothetical protein
MGLGEEALVPRLVHERANARWRQLQAGGDEAVDVVRVSGRGPVILHCHPEE